MYAEMRNACFYSANLQNIGVKSVCGAQNLRRKHLFSEMPAEPYYHTERRGSLEALAVAAS